MEAAWQRSVAPPQRRGTVRLLVARRGGGEHDTPQTAALTAAGGLQGDRWSAAKRPSMEKQLTLMNATAAELVCDGQPLHMPGDNLVVDLDLGEETMPAGTRLRVGTALIEVTAKPHTGCKVFEARFGADALRWVNAPERRPRRLRGVNCRVVEDGEVTVGDTIENLGA